MMMFRRFLSMFVLLALAACGGGSENAGTPPFSGEGSGGGGGSGGGTPVAADLVLVLSASDIADSGQESVTATATAVDANRNAVAGVPVSFSVDNNAIVTPGGTVTDDAGRVTAAVGIGADSSLRTITVTATSGTMTRQMALKVVTKTSGTAAEPRLELKLLDASGQVTTTIATGQPVRAQAVLRDAKGVTVKEEIVQFGVEQPADLVRIDPIAGAMLTDASGTAQVTVSSLGTLSGAGRVRADAKVGDKTVTGSANFFTTATGGQPPSTLTLSPLKIGSANVSAYGTTGVEVQVLQNGLPFTSSLVTVNFTTSCATDRATISPVATTRPDGTAVATFVDNGCAQAADTDVTLTASIATDTKSGSTRVLSPTTGSLRFLSVEPSDKSITLRGQGGNARQENATVTFKLVDVAGQGVGNADVCFDSTTYIGGLNVDGYGPGTLPNPQGSATLCGSDALAVVRYVKRTNPDGTVSVQINSGTVPTPVRVRARAIYPLQGGSQLESFSDTLSISTGLPLQRSFSLSVDKANIDGGNFDGEIATLTIRLADQFSNPVPDGTVVNFIGSGAAVCTADNGSCKTTNGVCSCNVVSQERRPVDGRVVVTAYAVGLEDFDDTNGDNVYTPGVDGFAGHDLGDAYVDANKDGKAGDGSVNGGTNPTINRDTDILVPYQKLGAYTRDGDGTRGTAHIRASTIIYLSQSSSTGDPTAVIPLADLHEERTFAGGRTKFLRMQAFCPQGAPLPSASVNLVLDDGIGNPMAAGTTLSSADPSDNVAPGAPRPSSVLALGARPPSTLLDLPNMPKVTPWTTTAASGNIPTGHGVLVKGVQDKCSGNGSFAVEAKSPRGAPAFVRLLYEGEPRTMARSRLPIKYLDSNDVQFTVVKTGGNSVRLAPISWITAVGVPDPSPLVYAIDWDVNTGGNEVTVPISTAPQSFTYAAAGTYTIQVTVVAGGQTYSGTQTVVVP